VSGRISIATGRGGRSELPHGVVDRPRHLGRLHDAPPPLRHAPDRVELVVHLVEDADLLPEVRLRDLADDQQDRRGGGVGGAEPGGGIEEAGAGDDQRGRDPAAGAGVAVGHVGRGLLVARRGDAEAELVAATSAP
jgi:hypothetical protein